MDIWFIADTHFGHRRIIEYESRPFSCVNEMDEILIENWNNLIKDNDIVYHLGDIFICSSKRQEEISKRLKGNKYLFLGNHDKATITKYNKLGFNVLCDRNHVSYKGFKHDNYSVELSHIPIEETIKNIHGHVHSNIDKLDQIKYKCVSVECTSYKPLHFDEIIEWLTSNK